MSMTEDQFQSLDARALRMVDLLPYIGDPGCQSELDGRIDEARAYIRADGTTYADGDRVVTALVARGNAILGGRCYEGSEWTGEASYTPSGSTSSGGSTTKKPTTTTKTPTSAPATVNTTSRALASAPSSRLPLYVAAGLAAVAAAAFWPRGGRR